MIKRFIPFLILVFATTVLPNDASGGCPHSKDIPSGIGQVYGSGMRAADGKPWGCNCDRWLANKVEKGTWVATTFPFARKCDDGWEESKVNMCSGYELDGTTNGQTTVSTSEIERYEPILDESVSCWKFKCTNGSVEKLTDGKRRCEGLKAENIPDYCMKKNPTECIKKSNNKSDCIPYRDTCILKCDIQNPVECSGSNNNNSKRCIIANGICMPLCDGPIASKSDAHHETFIEIKF